MSTCFCVDRAFFFLAATALLWACLGSFARGQPRSGQGPRADLQAEEVRFTPAEAGLSGVTMGSSSIADVSGDGNRDLLLTGQGADSTATAALYLGDGQGGFTRAEADLTGAQFSSSSIADLNEDGALDLLVLGRGSDKYSTTTLYLGDGEGGFSETKEELPRLWTGASAVADVNGDDHLDLLLSGGTSPNPTWANYARSIFSYITGGGSPHESGPTSKLYLGNGQGSFAEARAELPEIYGRSALIGDVNGDGLSDLIISGGMINGSFETGTSKAGTAKAGTSKEGTIVLIGNEEGDFAKAEAGLPKGDDVSIGDVNEDGHLDLLITGHRGDQTQAAALFLGDGEGGFTEAEAGLAPVGYSASTITDIDGNGTKDLVISGVGEDNALTANVYLGNGEGKFREGATDLEGLGGGSISVADMNGDGVPDLVLTGFDEEGTPRARLYLGSGQRPPSKATPE